jgi:hypothetical protein
MSAVYKAYLWRYGKLETVAENIVAPDRDKALDRAVQALRHRTGKEDDPLLVQLTRYIYAHGPWPEGVTVQIVKEVDTPQGQQVVFG